MIQLVVPPTFAAASKRLDLFLVAAKVTTFSRAKWQQLIAQGCVAVDGKVASAKHSLRAGAVITIDLPPEQPPTLTAEAIPLDILYEDAELLVINKPVGLTVHPGSGRHEGTLVQALLHHCRDLSHIGGPLRPGIVHRLDKDTSGVMVVAKNDSSHAALAAQFAERLTKKVYQAIVWKGPPSGQMSGTIARPVGRHPHKRQQMSSRATRIGKPADTDWSVSERFGHFALLNVQPRTGRTHQIRVHFADQGWPILGDLVYGGQRQMKGDWAAPLNRLKRQALHAASLAFTHPRSGERLQFSAPLPPDLADILALLRRYDSVS